MQRNEEEEEEEERRVHQEENKFCCSQGEFLRISDETNHLFPWSWSCIASTVLINQYFEDF